MMNGAEAETVIDLPDLEATRRLGAALARLAAPGDVIALSGDLGAGKSELARAYIRSRLGPDEEVPSPTFTLVQTYEFPGVEVWHMDLYRLERPEDADELGVEDAFAGAVSLIEWPERLGPRLPSERLSILLRIVPGGRRATLVGTGRWADRLKEIVAHA